MGSVWEREILIPGSGSIGPQIGDASTSQKCGWSRERGMGRVAVEKRLRGKRDREGNERWEEINRTNGTNERVPR